MALFDGFCVIFCCIALAIFFSLCRPFVGGWRWRVFKGTWRRFEYVKLEVGGSNPSYSKSSIFQSLFGYFFRSTFQGYFLSFSRLCGCFLLPSIFNLAISKGIAIAF